MDSQELIDLESQVLLQNYKRFPIVFAKGEGVYLWDKEGKKYLDFLSGIAVNALGHSHPKLVAALCTQVGQLMHISNYYHHEAGILLGELLNKLTFPSRVFYCNSGTEANEAAIKLARKYGKTKLGEGKTQIITTLDSFHGRTMGALAATGQPKYQEAFQPLPPGFAHVPFNDLEAMEKAVSEATCAVMVEPIQGESGVHPASLEYLQGLRKLCTKKGILLILDEIQTGLGRTGKMFAYQHYGIVPDLLILAKALGGGFPIGAMVMKEELGQILVPGDHGTTFGGNPLACTAALTTVRTILEEGLLEKAAQMGEYFWSKLEELQKTSGQIKLIRGKGLMLAVELKEIKAKAVAEQALAQGLVLNNTGEYVLRFLPPLIITKEQVDEGVKILGECLAQLK